MICFFILFSGAEAYALDAGSCGDRPFCHAVPLSKKELEKRTGLGVDAEALPRQASESRIILWDEDTKAKAASQAPVPRMNNILKISGQ